MKSTRLDRRDSEIVEFLPSLARNLNDEILNGALLVVEGKRDVEALKSIGVQGKFFLMSHGRGFAGLLSEALGYSKVILLLDLDGEGNSLTRKVMIHLHDMKIKVDHSYRKAIGSVGKGRLRQIEELIRYRNFLSHLKSTNELLL